MRGWDFHRTAANGLIALPTYSNSRFFARTQTPCDKNTHLRIASCRRRAKIQTLGGVRAINQWWNMGWWYLPIPEASRLKPSGARWWRNGGVDPRLVHYSRKISVFRESLWVITGLLLFHTHTHILYHIN